MHAEQNPGAPIQGEAPETSVKPVVVRALVDIPPFVDQAGRFLTLKAGDLATVSDGIAGILVRRSKAALVEEVAA
ncbi:MAG: hypothetical protein ACYC2H_10175 [Thermoplasmatota archaeon]